MSIYFLFWNSVGIHVDLPQCLPMVLCKRQDCWCSSRRKDTRDAPAARKNNNENKTNVNQIINCWRSTSVEGRKHHSKKLNWRNWILIGSVTTDHFCFKYQLNNQFQDQSWFRSANWSVVTLWMVFAFSLRMHNRQFSSVVWNTTQLCDWERTARERQRERVYIYLQAQLRECDSHRQGALWVWKLEQKIVTWQKFPGDRPQSLQPNS